MIALGLPCPGVWLAAQVVDEQELDDENPYRPGVVARYSGNDAALHARLEELIQISPSDGAPDRRIAPGPFRATYDAQLLVQAPGVHRLRVYAAGRVRVKLADKLVLDAVSTEPGWLAAEPIELSFGFHPLRVEYVSEQEPARLSVCWEGPGFALEPLAARWLFHEAGATPDGAFERGQQLTRALRCAACHDIPGERQPLPAPALDHLADNLSRAWIEERLSAATDDAHEAADGMASSRNMPHFALAPDDAAAVADYLIAAALPDEPLSNDRLKELETIRPSAEDKTNSKQSAEKPSAAAGAALFNTVGCLACHRVGKVGSDGLFGGGDLTSIASKRPPGFFARWLAHPEHINRQHRMPVFALSELERDSLSLYLQTLGKRAVDETAIDAESSSRGAAIVKAERCGACHVLPSASPATVRLPLDTGALEHATNTCLLEPDAKHQRPGYRLPERDRQAIATYIRQLHPRGADGISGRDVLAERNCLACHARGHAPGLAAILPDVAATDESLATVLPLLRAPSLVGVGDKLRDEALAASISRSSAPRQTWLRVRMPSFPLDKADSAALVRHFIEADRIPPQHEVDAPEAPLAHDSAIEGAGARLVTADGFGCTSCHAIGAWTPQKVAPGSEGASLSLLGDRVRRPWFDRWVRNPVRIVPDMEMPAIVKPIRGVLGEQLDRQIASIWYVLDRPGFTPPAPNALRVVRQSNLPGDDPRAAVLTDVIEVGDVPFAKPLVIGLANRHNVLYDLATGRLAAWWTGDTARQQTRGKTWFWEAGVPQLLGVNKHEPGDDVCELVLIRDGRRLTALPHQQYVTELDTLEHVDSGLEFVHRLHFEIGSQTHAVNLTQRFVALPASASGNDSGFRRRVRIESLPRDAQGEWLALPGDVTIDDDGRSATLTGKGASLRVSLVEPAAIRLQHSERGAVIAFNGDAGPFLCELEYRAALAVDQFAPLPVVDRSLQKIQLDVVPGFEAVRLPLDDRCMPTGLAWQADGTLIVASLEGRVWLARDTDGDELEDSIEPFSDDLAAPYGVAAAGNAIDVLTKVGLLRLFDNDGDGRADRTQQIASGWGHTPDYHDWAVGLERDAEGNYYIALPCEQDNRSEAAAHLRGRALRLVPRTATGDDPRLYAIEEI
ncbi:MAG: c-type cytochrome, partial [Pirellulales bacterium]